MGLFNSAPIINKIDSQYDSLDTPKGSSTSELLQHVKDLRGDQQPPLLSRFFSKPLSSMSAQMVASDITDGLRCFNLDAVSRFILRKIMGPINLNKKNFDTRIWEVWRVQSNQAYITGREICVCTTHLKARHGALLYKLRNEQGSDFKNFVKQFVIVW